MEDSNQFGAAVDRDRFLLQVLNGTVIEWPFVEIASWFKERKGKICLVRTCDVCKIQYVWVTYEGLNSILWRTAHDLV